jgi:hypothetical protein
MSEPVVLPASIMAGLTDRNIEQRRAEANGQQNQLFKLFKNTDRKNKAL